MPRDFYMYYIIIIVIVALDQIVKKVVAGSMSLHQSIPVIGDFFQITYIHNRGAAFSMLEDFRILLIVLPLIFICAALYYITKRRETAKPMFMLSVSFIVAGGLGNLIDRLFFGYVVDYLDLQLFAVFNIADIFVCIGCGLLLIYVIFFDGKKAREA